MMHIKLTRFAGNHEEESICLPLPGAGATADWFQAPKLGLFLHWGLYAIEEGSHNYELF